MKRGTIVAVCHDGKWCRRVKGEVVATRRGHHILVRFPHPDTGEAVEFWARRHAPVRYRRERTQGCITSVSLKRAAYFGGWADIAWFCPWYAVYPWTEMPVTLETTFLAEVRAGRQTLGQVDDWVARWHASPGEAFGLREYLGMTDDQYAAWVKDSTVLGSFL